jgi:hypothetical protein
VCWTRSELWTYWKYHDDDDGEDGDDDTVLGPNACKFWLKGCGQEKSHCNFDFNQRNVDRACGDDEGETCGYGESAVRERGGEDWMLIAVSDHA